MREVDDRKFKKKIYLSLIVIFIISDVIAGNYLFSAFVKEPPARGFSLFIGLIFLQIIASPIQAGPQTYMGEKRAY